MELDENWIASLLSLLLLVRNNNWRHLKLLILSDIGSSYCDRYPYFTTYIDPLLSFASWFWSLNWWLIIKIKKGGRGEGREKNMPINYQILFRCTWNREEQTTEKKKKRLKKKGKDPCKEVQLTFTRRLLISEFSVNQQNNVFLYLLRKKFKIN